MGGRLPKGWKRVRLADVATVQTGIAKNGEKKLARPVELPYLRVANVQDGQIDLQELKTISVEAARVDRYRLRAGDVLMTEGGDFDKLGRGAVWRGQVMPCLHQNHVFAVRANRARVLPEYLAAYCAAEPGRRYFLACSKQTTNLASVNSTQLKAMPLNLPTLDEQYRIVAALTGVDSGIALTRRALARACELHRGIVSRLVLGGIRHPTAFNLMRGRQLIERGWSRNNVSGLAKEMRRINREKSTLPVLSSTKLSGIVFSDDYFGKRVYSADTSTYKRVSRGEFVYATNHIEEGSIGLQDICDEGLVSPMYTVFAVDEAKVNPAFLYAVFKTETYRQIFQANTSASVDRRGSLRWKDFSTLPVYLPTLEVQDQIVRALAAVQQQVDLESQRLDALRRQKRGLLQKLLTGEWRLPRDLPDTEVADVGA